MKLEDRYTFIGKKIKEMREKEGLSQKDLAEKLGYESSTAISLIESGDRKVSVSDLEKIADILNKDIKYFLGKEGEAMDVNYALRSENGLSGQDKQEILRFIDFVKQRRDGKH